MCKEQQFDKLEDIFPAIYAKQGNALKAQYQYQVPIQMQQLPHYWIYGPTGTGKSNIVEVLWPKLFKKRADSDWGLYSMQHHTCVYVPDVDPKSFEQIGSNNLKTWCDPQGFNANVKFKGGLTTAAPQLVITSNFELMDLFHPGTFQVEGLKEAAKRRFEQIHISDLLSDLGLIQKPLDQLKALQRIGNIDKGLCFTTKDGNEIDTIQLSQSKYNDRSHFIPIPKKSTQQSAKAKIIEDNYYRAIGRRGDEYQSDTDSIDTIEETNTDERFITPATPPNQTTTGSSSPPTYDDTRPNSREQQLEVCKPSACEPGLLKKLWSSASVKYKSGHNYIIIQPDGECHQIDTKELILDNYSKI